VDSSSGPGSAADGRAVRFIRHDPDSAIDTSGGPATVPAVEQMLREGLELASGVTVMVGENGSGKSTIVEMLAEACGLNPQGGSAMGRLFRTRDSEPGLGKSLIVERAAGRPHWSYFLRADTMHTLYSYLEHNPGRRPERFHELSHGEGCRLGGVPPTGPVRPASSPGRPTATRSSGSHVADEADTGWWRCRIGAEVFVAGVSGRPRGAPEPTGDDPRCSTWFP
jgi:AAA domain